MLGYALIAASALLVARRPADRARCADADADGVWPIVLFAFMRCCAQQRQGARDGERPARACALTIDPDALILSALSKLHACAARRAAGTPEFERHATHPEPGAADPGDHAASYAGTAPAA